MRDLVKRLLETRDEFAKVEVTFFSGILREGLLNNNELSNLEFKLKNIHYKDFLNTLYWSCVKRIKKPAKNKCTICSSQKSLVLHHNTYENNGQEHLHLEDLVYVCHRCHKMIHDNIEIGRGSEYTNDNFSLLDFDTFWLMYDKKREKKIALRMWDMLSSEEIRLVSSHIDYYLEHKKESQYRMYPAKYLARFCSKKVVPNGDIQITRDIVHYVEEGVIYVR